MNEVAQPRLFTVRAGHARPIWAGHPWVYASAVEEVGEQTHGDVGRVVDPEGRIIGWGLVSDTSAIRIRLLATGEPSGTVEELLTERIASACALRRKLFPRPEHTNAYRLIHAEGDRLPGLVVDRYADVLVAQFATRPVHARRALLAECLLRESGAACLVAREAGYEAAEGIPGPDVGFAAGGTAPEAVRVLEEGMALEVQPLRGQKTGHYTDQRENRVRVAEMAAGGDLLDLYAGTGGFSIQALRMGARGSLAVESSARAVAMLSAAADLNDVSSRIETREEDARHVLRELKQTERTFDTVVCDPPNFFPRRGGAGHAVKAYRELNVQAITRVRKGGIVATFVCSAHMQPKAWGDLVRSSARECRRTLRALRVLSAGPDHPVLAAAPEGGYLTGLLAVVDA